MSQETSKLKEHIATVERRCKQTKKTGQLNALFSLGWRIAIEWTTAVLVGYGIGYLFDMWTGLAPWGKITFLLLGNIAGVLDIYRTYKNEQQAL